ncbi:chemotaxis protein CheW [Clostridium sp. Marseille-P299]|uniref:chemotaxis protein CheW n=1 Tax=Clostridium sp. Marseille-P299 TaxID=1805477 RepID=UPI00082ADB5A|nr:chemotaxis protein CheW [Clostridium sp. Marseille-P299]
MEKNYSIATDSKQYIVIKLGNEQYGINIAYIDNIVRMQRITRVPKAQPYFKGVINIRGEIIPVMSLRLKFDLEPDEITNATRIIIIKLEPQAAIGFIVDEVKEVITLEDENIDFNSGVSNDDRTAYLYGVGKHGDTLISLLNLPAVIIDKEKEVRM